MNVTNNDRKKALLLHLAGEAVFDIFEGLVVSEIPEGADPLITNSYTVAKAALDNHFNPKKNVEFERYTFRSTKQNMDENIVAAATNTRISQAYSSLSIKLTNFQLGLQAKHQTKTDLLI